MAAATSLDGTTCMGADAVLALRRTIYAKEAVTRDDLAELLARGREAGASRDYADLLGEVATDLLVHQVKPSGYITAADSEWLIAQLSKDGALTCRAEFEMLRDAIGHAVSVPPVLTLFAVRAVQKAILAGRRDATGGIDHEAGTVTHDDVEALRCMVFAATKGSSLHVSRESAEILFEIAHATAAGQNDPSFADFFAKAVGNYLMGVAFQGTPEREDVLESEEWFEKPSSFGKFVSQMAGAPKSLPFAEALRDARAGGKLEGRLEEAAFAKQDEAYETAEQDAAPISAGEADWVRAHLARAGGLSLAEKKLLEFIKEEAADMPASFRALIATA